MHELGIATPLLKIVLEEVERQEKKQNVELAVTEIVMHIGLLVDIEARTLKACFELLAENTKASGAELVIETKPLAGFCNACQKNVSITKRAFVCHFCKSTNVSWEKSGEMQISTIKVRPVS